MQLRAASPGGGGRSRSDLLPLPRMPAADWQRLAIQARFPRPRVAGRDYVRRADEDGEERMFHCPDCGGTASHRRCARADRRPGGAFADPSPPPTVSVYDSRRIRGRAASSRDRRVGVARRPAEAGEYAEAADRGRELVEAHPENAQPCTTSRAARASRGGRATRSKACGAQSSARGCARRLRGLGRSDPRRARVQDLVA